MYKNGKMSKEEVYLVDNTSVAFNEYLQIRVRQLNCVSLVVVNLSRDCWGTIQSVSFLALQRYDVIPICPRL